MSEEKNKKGRGFLRMLLPTGSIGQSYALMKNQVEIHKETAREIRSLWAVVRKGLSSGKGMSLEELVHSKGAKSVHRHFLLKKRIALLAGLIFGILGLGALFHGNLFGVATIGAAVPLFLALALSAQMRLWQLETRAYQAGLDYFIRKNPFWILDVLNPSDFSGKGDAG